MLLIRSLTGSLHNFCCSNDISKLSWLSLLLRLRHWRHGIACESIITGCILIILLLVQSSRVLLSSVKTRPAFLTSIPSTFTQVLLLDNLNTCLVSRLIIIVWISADRVSDRANSSLLAIELSVVCLTQLLLVDVLVKRCWVSLISHDSWRYFLPLMCHPKHRLVVRLGVRSDRQRSLKQVVSFACRRYSLWCLTGSYFTWRGRELSRPIVVVMRTWIATSASVCARVSMIPVTALLFSVVMVSLLDFIFWIEKVEDHRLHCLLLMRVSHLLQLGTEFLSVLMRLIVAHLLLLLLHLSVLQAHVSRDHDRFQRLFRLYLLLRVTTSRSKCTSVLANGHDIDASILLKIDLGCSLCSSFWTRDQVMIACSVHVLTQMVDLSSLIILNWVVSLWWLRWLLSIC